MKSSSSDPRVLVLGENTGFWSSKDRQALKNTMNGVEAWVFAFNGDYLGYNVAKEKEIANYDIIIANTKKVSLPKYLRLRDKLPVNSKWVALMEGSGSDYITPQLLVKQAFDAADVVNCINRYSLPLLRAITTSRVEYLGIPYPAEGIRKFAVPVDLRKNEVFICPSLLSRWNDYFVAKKLGLKYYGSELLLTRKFKMLFENYMNYGTLINKTKFFDKVDAIYQDPDLHKIPIKKLEDVFKTTGNSLLWVNLDDRYTWGRNVLDAAALQIPIITTRSTGHAEDFFQDTMVVDEFDLESAVNIGRRLIDDREFYFSVSQIPIEKFDHLSHENMKNKLLSWF